MKKLIFVISFVVLSGFIFGLSAIDVKAQVAPGCTTYNNYIYCRGFRSTDPQGSSCNAACSARGYTCPVGDNMFRSVSQIIAVARTLGILGSTETYNSYALWAYYSPYIRNDLYTGAKMIYYDSGWNQTCTHSPGTDSRYQRIKICRCQGSTVNHTLSVSKSGTGTVTSSPAGINCGNTCSASYGQGTTVNLTATPATGSRFTGWSGACTGTGTCTVTMDSNKSVGANFEASEITFALTGTLTGSSLDNSKVIISHPDGSNTYMDSFVRDYSAGVNLRLRAVPADGSVFTGWSGHCAGKEDCYLTMNGIKSVTAVFNNPKPECITYDNYIYCRSFKSTDPQGSSCQAACSQRGLICEDGNHMLGTTKSKIRDVFVGLGLLTLSDSYCPQPDDATFLQRSYSIGGKSVRYNITGTQVCNFAQSPNDSDWKYINMCRCRAVLTGSIRGTGYGTVNVNPPNVNYSSNFTRTYDDNPVVTLTATPAAGSVFAGWSGCDSVSGTDSRICTVNINRNRTVTATFNKSLGVECTRYGTNQYLYCRGFKSTDPQGSSCNAACSARGYTCPVGDNMIRSTSQILELAQTFGLWNHTEQYSFYAHSSYYSPFVRKDIYSSAKTFYFASNWYQVCTHAPSTDWRYERVKICRCLDSQPKYSLSVRSYPGTGVSITSNTGHSGTTDYSRSISAKTSVSLTASSPHVFGGEYYAFSGWTGCISSKNQTINFSMPSSNVTCHANYEKMNIMQYMGNQLASLTNIVSGLIEQTGSLMRR